MVGMFLMAGVLAMTDQRGSTGLPPGLDGGRPFGSGPARAEQACLPDDLHVGQPVPDVTLRMAEAHPKRVRVLRPGSAATMDFIPARVNLIVDERGMLLQIRCG